MRSLVAGLLLGLVATAPVVAAETLEPVAGAVHVHSDLSTGDFSIEQLVEMADKQGIGAVLLSENYLDRVEYGVAPFRALTRVVHEERSVGEATADYLARIRRARETSPRVLIVPGVEVMPHYRWTGTPLTLELGLHDTQKNLLVWGIEDPGALARLPVVGNRRLGVWSTQSVLDAVPVLLVVPGLWLLRRRPMAPTRIGRAVIVAQRRRWGRALVLCAIAVAAALRGWPFTTDRFPPYGDFGIEPHQALIDAVDAAGGVTVWSFPEARDFGERTVGPVHVTWATQPYADDLLRTFRYTAFGALYEDTTTVERPGGEWDRLLQQYAAGERSRPAWGLAESGFHGFTAGKAIGPVRTVFLVQERSAKGVVEAMRRGRMYAVLRTAEWGFDLAEFTVGSGEATAIMGQALRAAAGAPIDARATIAASDGAAHDVRVTLVRNGAVVEVWSAQTPLTVVHHDVADGAPAVYRLDVRAGAAQRLLSNPVFVTP